MRNRKPRRPEIIPPWPASGSPGLKPLTPILTATPASIEAGASVQVTLTNGLPSQRIDWGDGAVTQAQANATHTYSAAGTRSIRLLDAAGQPVAGVPAVLITVRGAVAPPPTLSLSPASPTTGQTVTISVQDALAGDTLDYGDEQTAPAQASQGHVYTAAGTLTVRVLRDGVSVASQSLTVTAAVPVIAVSPSSPAPGQTVTATLRDFQPGDLLDWRDKSTQVAASPTATHSYSAAGTYVVAIKRNKVVVASSTVTVAAAPAPAPSATLMNDGDAFTLSWGPSASMLYVVYSSYAETGRMYVPISGWVQGTTFTDPNVYDGRAVWYQVYRLVNGVEVLHATLNGTQPARVWTDPTTLQPGRHEGLSIRSLDPAIKAINLVNGQTTELYDLVNCRIAGMGRLVSGFFNRVRMRGCRLWGLNPGGTGRDHGNGLHLEQFRHADIQHNYFEEIHSNYLTEFDKRGQIGDTLIFSYNMVRNVMGQKTDGAGGYRTGNVNGTDFSFSQALQISKCKALAGGNNTNSAPLRGAQIMWNLIVNEPGYSRVEDNISFYQTHGYADSKIQVRHNMIDGAYTWRPGVHTAYSGGGIMIGDEGGNHIEQSDNHVIRFTNYGIAIMNGTGNRANRSRAIRGARTWDGVRIAVQPPSGIVAAQFWDYNRVGAAMNDNQMNDNFLACQYEKPDGTRVTNVDFITVAGQNGNEYLRNTRFSGTVTVAMEQAEHGLWRDELRAASLTFGTAA